MKCKENIQLTIEDLTESGDGVARYNSRVVFVEGGIIGDTVQASITQIKKKYIKAKVIKVITPSKDRINPPCPYAYKCGGCTIQHIAYDTQLKIKENIVKDALERIGQQYNFKLNPIVGMSIPYHYRNKALYPAGIEKGKVVFGFYQKGSHRLVKIEDCIIQNQKNSAILNIISNWANANNISVYDEANHQGLLRHIMLRNTKDNRFMVGLIINGKKIPHVNPLIDALTQAHPEIESVMLNVQTKKGNTILGREYQCLYGNHYIIDHIGHLKFKLSMASFFQVNPEQTVKLYNIAENYASLTGREILWDIYSGAGTISLQFAQKAKHVYGNEIVLEAIENAKENANINNVENVTFIQGAAEAIVPTWLDYYPKPDVVVLDPPRKGADQDVLKAIVDINVERIVYISCKPSTLARDIKYLSEYGYKLQEVTPVDMFGHSMHVECVILMSRVEK